MAESLNEKIKKSIRKQALDMISDHNKYLVRTDDLILSLQTHTDAIQVVVDNALSESSDVGPSEDEAIYDSTRDFFYRFDFKRVIASVNQNSIHKVAKAIKSENSKSFSDSQRLVRTFCEQGIVITFDRLREKIDSFIDGIQTSDDSFLSVFDSRSPHLVGSPEIPSDLFLKNIVDIEPVLSRNRFNWLPFVERVIEDLANLEPSDNLKFAENFLHHLEQNNISKNDFHSLYKIECSLKLSHRTLSAPKIRGGISDLLEFIKGSCQSRFENLFSEASKGLCNALEGSSIEKLTDFGWLNIFDPYTLLLSNSVLTVKELELIIGHMDDAIVSSEILFSELTEDLRDKLNSSGWINESGSLNLNRPISVLKGKIGDLTYDLKGCEARIADVQYLFTTKMQRSVFEWLIEEFERGEDSVAETDLLARLKRTNPDSKSKFLSLRDSVFKAGSGKLKQHPAWGKIIVLRNKRVYLITDRTKFGDYSKS
jgi:hypothetical protein